MRDFLPAAYLPGVLNAAASDGVGVGDFCRIARIEPALLLDRDAHVDWNVYLRAVETLSGFYPTREAREAFGGRFVESLPELRLFAPLLNSASGVLHFLTEGLARHAFPSTICRYRGLADGRCQVRFQTPGRRVPDEARDMVVGMARSSPRAVLDDEAEVSSSSGPDWLELIVSPPPQRTALANIRSALGLPAAGRLDFSSFHEEAAEIAADTRLARAGVLSRERVRHAMARLGRMLSCYATLDELLDALSLIVRDVFGADSVNISMLISDHGEVVLRHQGSAKVVQRWSLLVGTRVVGFISHSPLDSWAEAMLLELLPWAGMHLEAGLMHSGVSEMLALRSLSHSERKSRLEEGFSSLPGASWLVHQSTGEVELATADGAASLAAEPRLSAAIARVAQDARFAEDAGRVGLTLAFQTAPYALVTRTGRGRARTTRDKSTLTNRQREVLALVLKGNSNRQIAETLGCSRRTAEHHVAAILAKTGQPTRAALVATLWEGDDGRPALDERAPDARKTQALPD